MPALLQNAGPFPGLTPRGRGPAEKGVLRSVSRVASPADGSEWWSPSPLCFFFFNIFRRLASAFGTDSSILAFIFVKTFGIHHTEHLDRKWARSATR